MHAVPITLVYAVVIGFVYECFNTLPRTDAILYPSTVEGLCGTTVVRNRTYLFSNTSYGTGAFDCLYTIKKVGETRTLFLCN